MSVAYSRSRFSLNPLALRLAPTSQARGKSASIRGQCHAQGVGVRSGLGGGGRRNILPCGDRPRLSLGFGSGAGLSDFAGFSRAPRSPCCHVRYVRPNDPSGCLGSAPPMQPRWHKALAANSAKARENVDSARHLARAAASHISGATSCRRTASRSAGWWSECCQYGLRDKGPCQDGALARRTPGKAMPAGQERLDPDHAQNADQLPVMSPLQRAARRIVEPRQKFLFRNVQPVGG